MDNPEILGIIEEVAPQFGTRDTLRVSVRYHTDVIGNIAFLIPNTGHAATKWVRGAPVSITIQRQQWHDSLPMEGE